jgi:hypothetical protein
MSRALTALMLAEIQAGSLSPILFYEGEFASDTIRLWTGLGTITWNGYLWTGLGNLLSIGAIKETTGIEATGFQIAITGESSDNISRALSACRQNKPGKLWLGAMGSSGNVIADPYQVRVGKFSQPRVYDDGQAATISLIYEDELVDLERTRERRYTSESQAETYPTDKGFDFVPQLQDAAIMWAGLP